MILAAGLEGVEEGYDLPPELTAYADAAAALAWTSPTTVVDNDL